MKLEVIRMLKAAASDATYGVNAKIAAVALDGSDSRPAALGGPYADVDDKWVARRKLNTEDTDVTLPALAIFQFAPLRAVDQEVHTIIRDVSLQVCYAQVIKKGASDAVMRDVLYRNRAILQHLNWLMQNDQSSAFRRRNNIQIRFTEELTQDDVELDWDAASVLAATLVTLRIRELTP